MQIISNVALISINETLFIQLLSFLIFLYVIDRIMFRPLKATMNDRIRYVEGLQEEVAEAESELVQVTRKIRTQEAEARSEAMRLRGIMEDEGRQAAAEILGRAGDEIARKKTATEERVAAQIAEARKQIEADSRTLAVHIMEKILERSLTR